jgi:peptide/nickel transport system permease protein
VQRLIAVRLLHSLLVLAVVSVGSFALMRYTPGDPVAALVGEQTRTRSPEDLARIRRNLGLDDPVYVQYGRWLKNALRGDLGYSLGLRRPVTTLIGERLVPSFTLLGISLLLSIALGVSFGILSALRRYTAFDYAVTIFSFIGNSMPQVWIGLMLIFLFALKLDWLPAGGMTTLGSKGGGFIDRVTHLLLPVATLTMTNLVVWTRYQRTSLIDVLGQDYVRVARAKGLRERTVLLRHAWRNSLLPIVTLLGNSVVFLVEGAYIVETIFSWPGLGRLGVDAILKRDYPLVMGVAILSSLFIITGNLLADLAYGLLNPRLRHYSGGR